MSKSTLPAKEMTSSDFDPDAFVKRYAEILNELDELRKRRAQLVKSHETLRAKVQALKKIVEDIDAEMSAPFDGEKRGFVEMMTLLNMLVGMIRDMKVWEQEQS